MAKLIKMPAAGQTTNKARIATVYVKEGDSVKRGDILLDAETDKAVLPVESYATGSVLKLLVSSGDEVSAGDVLLVVGAEGEEYGTEENPDRPAEQKSRQKEAPPEDDYIPIIRGKRESSATEADAMRRERGMTYPAMPNAKRLAKENGLDLASVQASNGQFVKREDVLRAVGETAGATGETTEEPFEVLRTTPVRAVIAKRMLESVKTIPSWQCTTAINMEGCMALKDAFKEKGVKISFNDLIAKAIAIAAEQYPLMKARYENDEIRVYKHVNIGLAVAVKDVLVVPVVRHIDQKDIKTIAEDYRACIEKARAGRLRAEDMGCGSVTISNLGMFDVDSFTAIVNPPESCILAVGRIRTVPVWDGKDFKPVNCMNVTGSYDHRFIDGAYGAKFQQELKRILENPALLFL